MKKLFITTMCTFALVGCNKSSVELTSKYNIPQELSDCKIYFVGANNGTGITVVRCPNSSTTTSYKQGKATRSVTVVEDEQK